MFIFPSILHSEPKKIRITFSGQVSDLTQKSKCLKWPKNQESKGLYPWGATSTKTTHASEQLQAQQSQWVFKKSDICDSCNAFHLIALLDIPCISWFWSGGQQCCWVPSAKSCSPLEELCLQVDHQGCYHFSFCISNHFLFSRNSGNEKSGKSNDLSARWDILAY